MNLRGCIVGHINTFIELSEMLPTARNEASKKHGDRYPELLARHKAVVAEYMILARLQPLESAVRLAKTIVVYGADPLMILAAGMEMVLDGETTKCRG